MRDAILAHLKRLRLSEIDKGHGASAGMRSVAEIGRAIDFGDRLTRAELDQMYAEGLILAFQGRPNTYQAKPKDGYAVDLDGIEAIAAADWSDVLQVIGQNRDGPVTITIRREL